MTRTEWAKRKGRSSSFISRSTRFAIYARDNFDCVYCASIFPPRLDGVGLTLDHVIPRSKGGSNRPDNLVTACVRCNSSRQNAERMGHLAYLSSPSAGRRVRDRIRRRLRKPINRELGRWLAHMFRPGAVKTQLPLTIKVPISMYEIGE